ncbi:MAG: virulence-associated E family protein [Thermoflexibacter sp.]|jgi:predicted P-loop ATPase|nr:virulence-associated E family protein [Thermoflexibacter sp.]
MKDSTEITIIDVKKNQKHQRDSQDKQGKSSWKKQKEQPTNKNEFSRVIDYLQEHYDFRYNEIRLTTEFREKFMVENEENEFLESDFREFESFDESELYITFKRLGYKISLTDLNALVQSRTIAPHFNPFKRYFDSLPSWNGQTDYFEKLASYLTFESESEKERFIRHLTKQFVRMIKQVLVKGYFNKQCLVISGNQNDGKTSLIRWFLPEYFAEQPKYLGQKYYVENLNPLSKDDLISLSQCFICNYDELATLSKQEIGTLKNFFAKASVYARHPYDRKPKDCKRNASFFGTTNESQFLIDHTGSVRWLCFVIKKIDFAYSKEMNINDLYSQALALYKQGFLCELTKAEEKENEEINRRFIIDTAAMNFVKRYFTIGDEQNHHEFFTATDVSLYIETEIKRKIHESVVGKALTALGFERKSKKIKGDTDYGYYVLINKKMQVETTEIDEKSTELVKAFLSSLSPQKHLINNLVNEYNHKFSPNIERDFLVSVIEKMNGNDSTVKYELQGGTTYLDITPF